MIIVLTGSVTPPTANTLGDIKGTRARANQTGILRGSIGCLKVLTEMVEGYRIWLDQISTSYGTQPQKSGLLEVVSDIYQEVYWNVYQNTGGIQGKY